MIGLGTADDVSVGTTVNDLVEALDAQTAYDVSIPMLKGIGGYSGTRMEIIHPTEPFAGRTPMRLDVTRANTESGAPLFMALFRSMRKDLPTGGQANILDVDGTRLVVVAMDFPETAAEDRAEMDAIIDSFVIEPGD